MKDNTCNIHTYNNMTQFYDTSLKNCKITRSKRIHDI